MPPLLHRRVRAKGFAPAHVAEVGVFLPEDSNVYGWITSGVRATLVEADPLTVDKIRAIPTGPQGPFARDVPTTAVVIEKAEVLAPAAAPAEAAATPTPPAG